MCYSPQEGEYLIGERFYDFSRGVIVISDQFRDDRYIQNAIAHEYRHHWQHVTGNDFNAPIDFEMKDEDYKDRIVKFFLSSGDEMDALLFSIKKAPEDVSLQWYEWIMEARNGKERIKSKTGRCWRCEATSTACSAKGLPIRTKGE